ncbi:hypothetical protein B0F90DRAFT_1211741 [Multifurca ochricompacta]|uniref:Uncharacterized protein n=1 Tax=Multifurca ochricompacta TaxID=376703 RepID=A0AAD4QJM4_9AGAM|nr:hypothetical protein B0F90DRAFT_1211741 [Multifurca ochricompacta]
MAVVFLIKSPLGSILSKAPDTSLAQVTPASRKLLMLRLPRLKTVGSLMRSFSDSARWRCPPASPADVRLKIARRPRMEDERVGTLSLSTCMRYCGAGSCARGCKCANGDDVCGIGMEPRETVVETDEEDKVGSVPVTVVGRCNFMVATLRRAASVPLVGVGGDSSSLVNPSLRFESTVEVISTRWEPEMIGDWLI